MATGKEKDEEPIIPSTEASGEQAVESEPLAGVPTETGVAEIETQAIEATAAMNALGEHTTKEVEQIAMLEQELGASMEERGEDGENAPQVAERIYTPLTPEEEAIAAAFMADYAAAESARETAPEKPKKRESGPEVAELEEMFASFEANHSLTELNAIIELSPDDAPNHPIRQPAKLALNPMVAKLNMLQKETDISSKQLDELEAKYKKFSRAVGMINNGKVDHNR